MDGQTFRSGASQHKAPASPSGAERHNYSKKNCLNGKEQQRQPNNDGNLSGTKSSDRYKQRPSRLLQEVAVAINIYIYILMSVLISTRGNIFRNDVCFSICLGSIVEPPACWRQPQHPLSAEQNAAGRRHCPSPLRGTGLEACCRQ